jgi:hypothetical protein
MKRVPCIDGDLLHKENLCPAEGGSLLDQQDENLTVMLRRIAGSEYALLRASNFRNEVLYAYPIVRGAIWMKIPSMPKLTIQCMRYMYRMLFMLFIAARPELATPHRGAGLSARISLESLRDVRIRPGGDLRVGYGYYLHETLSKLYDLIYSGYPSTRKSCTSCRVCSLNDVFIIIRRRRNF